MIKPAKILKATEEYYFSAKLKELQGLIYDGKPIINFGIGSPDLNPPECVINTMIDACKDNNAHRYQPYKGTAELREAIENFYKAKYNVHLSAVEEILPLLGSKEGIYLLTKAFVNPKDEILIPNPGYPTYKNVSNLVGASVKYYNLLPENNWLPDFNQLAKLVSSKTKLMWVNYPHMPTGAMANKEIFEKLIAFTQTNNILLVNDNAYSFILTNRQQSILQYALAYQNVVELNSLSKTFNMSGWRVGMLCGQKAILKQVLKVKTNIDSGMFYPIQKGAVKALNTSKEWYEKNNETYTTRRDLVWEICNQLGLQYQKDTSGMFVWAKIKSNQTDIEFSDLLIHKYNMFVAPGSIFGTQGIGYLRFSLCIPKKDLKICLERTKNFSI